VGYYLAARHVSTMQVGTVVLEGGLAVSTRAVTIIELLQEFVAQHGDETEVAVAVPGPRRQEIMALGFDQEIRGGDDPEPTGPPLVWLIVDEPAADAIAPPRHATVRDVP
jgi:hypothetical protein